MAFIPNPLPPAGVDYGKLLVRNGSAYGAISKLGGLGMRFSSPYLLARPLRRKEALASSGIEGTYSTMQQLYLFEIEEGASKSSPDTKEVYNYVRALDHSLEQLKQIPISTRLIRDTHKTLMEDVAATRGGDIAPGEYKRLQNYIGGIPPNARFVPCPPLETERLMGELEKFINSDQSKEIPPLVFIALVHYQFETIHPFPDGNGRVGRLLIPLLLKQLNALDEPILYISPVIEKRKEEYVRALFEVSREGNWLGWIDLFLQMVETGSENTIKILRELDQLRDEYTRRFQVPKTPALLQKVVSFLFEWPYLSVPLIVERLGITFPPAKKYVDKLVAEGILERLPETRMPTIYRASKIVEIIEQTI